VDPNHCANQDGDATCQEIGAGQFCSACGATNFGCVDERPDDACWFDSSPGEGSSSSSSSGTDATGSESDGSSSSGPPPACALEGEADPSCPEELPYCIGGECTTCDAGEAAFCAGLDPATPVCHAQWGRCVECTPDDASACFGVAWCGLDFTCGGCTEHAQCPNSACDLETGDCLDGELVMHVDNAICPDPGSGTEALPYCSIATAISQVGSGEKATIFLHGTSTAYNQGLNFTANPPRTIAVIGVDEPTIVVQGTGWAAAVANGNDLFVSRVRLSSGTGSGVQCTGSQAQVWIDDSMINNNVDGMDVDACKARLRRVRVIDNDGHGVQLRNNADLRLVSSVIANNGAVDEPTSGLHVTDSTIDVRYSTIANNDSILSGENIYCAAGGGGPIRNSVILAPGLNSIDCPWAETFFSVHDNAELVGSDNYDVEIFDPNWFIDVPSSDFHVRGPNSSLFRDRARWELGDPFVDLDGEPRDAYPGASGFAGADEP
jgi:hypothetical protein